MTGLFFVVRMKYPFNSIIKKHEISPLNYNIVPEYHISQAYIVFLRVKPFYT